MTIFAATAILALMAASGDKGDQPARPINRTVPEFPSSCMPKPDVPPPPHKVVVVYAVTKEGGVRDARIRESTDACFDETAIAAVRHWSFEPARSGRVAVEQEDLETTFNFVLGEATETQDLMHGP